ncbi:hypothetical protein [Actinoplanes sp. HUAS TT8]|uniref:hypothetical protein n=1 Tax=Actinoplanes sp. HUAS TT8 TaxID=3447453 RepID=UPI003F52610E
MADEISTPFFPHPSTSDTGDAPPYEHAGQDLSGQVPHLVMAWDAGSMPSFNTDLPDGAAGSGPPKDPPLAGDTISVNLGDMRDSLERMLTRTSAMVNQYETLAAKVQAAVSGGSIFGQVDTDEVAEWQGTGAVIGGSGGSVVPVTKPSPIQETAKEYAKNMNPMMQESLQSLGNAIELVGQYIGVVNVAGRTYAELERHSEFPSPPAGTGNGH